MSRKLLITGNDCYNVFPFEIANILRYFANNDYVFILSGKGKLSKDFLDFLEGINLQDRVEVYELKEENVKTNSKFKVKEYKYNINTENKKASVKVNGQEILVIDNIAEKEQLERNREFYSLIEEELLRDCDEALLIWNGDTTVKRLFNIVKTLGIMDKKIYSMLINGVPE